jgi:cell division protein FtsW
MEIEKKDMQDIFQVRLNKINTLAFLLIVIGLIFSPSASIAMYTRNYTSHLYSFLLKHAIFTSGLSLCFFYIYSKYNINFKRYANLCMVINIALLILVLLIGVQVKGSKRWINLFFFSLQPSEVCRNLFIIANAYNFFIRKKYQLLTSIFLSIVTLFLLAMEPDFGSTVIYISILLTQVFFSKLNTKIFGLVAFSMLIMSVSVYKLLPHAQTRVKLFLQPKYDTSYQTKKSIHSFLAGGVFGTGIGNGTIKYSLPDAHADYIFSLIAEETGLVGCIFLIILYGAFIFNITSLASLTMDQFKRNIIYGISANFTCNIIVNIACNLNLLPSKGASLPFIGYGGSAILNGIFAIFIINQITSSKKNFYSEYDRLYIEENKLNLTT